MSPKLKWLLILFGIGYLCLVIYLNRALYFSRFDEPYWKDKYEHSQWKLPLSVRTIGDDGLYLYEGWRLIQGEDPTTLNAEVPPFGKYLIGLSLKFLGNGYWFGLFTTMSAVIAFYLLAKVLLGSRWLATLGTLIFLLDPLVTSQFSLTMLDSLQLLFSLLSLLFLVLILKRNRPSKKMLLALGVCFGLFAATKAPIFSPFLGLVIVTSLGWQFKKTRLVIFFLAVAGLTYLLPYLPYFFLGHNLLEWAKVQKWIVNFYAHSNLSPNWGSVLTNLLFNRVQNIFSHVWESTPQWSFSWPVITLTGLGGLIISVKQNTWKAITSFLLLCLAFLSIIPFWSRYLLMVLPWLYLGYLKLFSQSRRRLIFLLPLIVINFYSSLMLLNPTPENEVKQFIYNWRYGFFQDMYEQISGPVKQNTNRTDFHRFGLTTYHDGQIEAVSLDLINPVWQRFSSQQQVKIRVSYTTRNLGLIQHEVILPIQKINHRWQIIWNWNYLLPGLDRDKTLFTTVEFAKRGNLIGSDRKFAEDIPGFLIWIIPNQIDKNREEKMLKFFEGIFEGRIAAISFHQKLFGNNLGHLSTPLGVVPFQVDPSLKAKILDYPGVTLTTQPTRIYRQNNFTDIGKIKNNSYFECCSYLYTTESFDGYTGLEVKYDNLLKGANGGSLVIKNQQGDVVKILLEKTKRDGEDVNL